jgi:alpha-ketoglutarate-dependent taurine dioxygenase
MKEDINFIDETKKGPIKIEGNHSKVEAQNWYLENKQELSELLTKHGAILLRNFGINDTSEFELFARSVSPNLQDYIVHVPIPKTKQKGRLYDYPDNRPIPMHNENAYTQSWPNVLLFFCGMPAEEGGYTPIANSVNVLSRLDPNFVHKCETEGIKYIRYYYDEPGLNWKNDFQERIENDCHKNGMTCEWLEGQPTLKTAQVCQATTIHPQTKQKVWFNQAHLFHPTILSVEDKERMRQFIGNGPFPRHACFGNGEEIEEEDIQSVMKAYEEEKIPFQWQKGDILILDNILMAHSRTPFAGKREIAVAMY